MTVTSQPATTTSQPWLLALALSMPVILLPTSRLFMLPIGILAIFGLFMLIGLLRHRQSYNNEDKALQILPRCILFIWLPMLISLIDAEYPQQVLKTIALYPFYGLAALAVVVLLRAKAAFKQVAIILSWIVCIWAFDGIAQVLIGVDGFNIPLNRPGVVEGHASGFFAHPNKYGFYMGMLAAIPLFTMYALGANRLTHIVVSLLLAVAVLMGAARGGWIMFAWTLLPYYYLVYVKPAKRPVVPLIVFPALVVGLFFAVLQVSPGMQERMNRSQGFTNFDYQSINVASSLRLDIYASALEAGQQHPINGVGVNSFEQTMREYFPPQTDKTMWPESLTMPHPHQVVLEIWSGAGAIGLFGFFLVWAAMWRLWRNATPAQRKLALPILMPLAVLWWPINTHRGFYPSELAAITLFFLAFSIAALTHHGDAK